jgi:hypothetical protein
MLRLSGIISRKSEVGSRKSEVGSRKSEDTEVGSRKSEVGSRKSEVGRHGSRKSEVKKKIEQLIRLSPDFGLRTSDFQHGTIVKKSHEKIQMVTELIIFGIKIVFKLKSIFLYIIIIELL